MPKSDPVVTPTLEGPAADPALLANAGATVEASGVGITMAVDTMQKFGRELEKLPANSKKLMDRALSSVSTVNHRSTVSSQKTSRTERRNSQQDSFIRLVNAIVDFSPMEIPSKAIIETFVLSSVILSVFSLSSFIGGYLLAPIITLIIPPVGAAILSSLVAPSVLYYQLSKGYGALDGFNVLTLGACVQGILTGSALANLSISSEPFVALSAIASSFAIAFTSQNTRTGSILLTIASSLIVHTVLGAIESALSPVYFVLTGLYTLAALIPIQLSAQDQRRANVNLYSAMLVGVTIASKCLVYGMLGASSQLSADEQVSTASQQQPQGAMTQTTDI